MSLQVVHALFGQARAARAFKLERLGDDGDRQNAQFFGDLGDDGGGAGARAAAHAGRDEHHVRAFQRLLDVALGLLGGGAAHFRVAARAQAARQVLAELQLVVGGGDVQHLDVGVHGDELDAGQAGVNHAVDGVGAAAAAADHFDAGERRLRPVFRVPLEIVSL